ncbi:hypothetical protein [Bradyrhizobium sp.]
MGFAALYPSYGFCALVGFGLDDDNIHSLLGADFGRVCRRIEIAS